MHNHVFRTLALFFVISLSALNGCGNGSGSTTAQSGDRVQGIAAAEVPVVGTVTLTDSSNPPVIKTATTEKNGSYAIEVNGLKPPFLLSIASAETATASKLYSFAAGPGIANINPFSTAAVAAAGNDGEFENLSDTLTKPSSALSGNFERVKIVLAEKLDPLFELYGIDEDPVTGDYESEKAEFEAFSKYVTITVSNGIVQVLNRQTTALIFTAPARNISTGTFSAQNMPSCTYTYSAWGACQDDNMQTRTVTGSNPPGCQAVPELTRACPASASTGTSPASGSDLFLRDSFSTNQAPSSWLGHAERVYSGNRVTVTGSYTISAIQLRMYNIGSPKQNLQVGIYSHDAAHDRPGSLLGNWSQPVSNANFTKTAPGQYVTFTGLNVPVTPGTYWIVFNIPTGTGDNNYHYSVAACINTTPRGQTYYNSGWGEFMNSQIIFGFYSSQQGS